MFDITEIKGDYRILKIRGCILVIEERAYAIYKVKNDGDLLIGDFADLIIKIETGEIIKSRWTAN